VIKEGGCAGRRARLGLAMTLLIREYLATDGRNPFREWLNRLETPAKSGFLCWSRRKHP
jgi:hypothetical protein